MPMDPYDAANKAYVDSTYSKLNGRIDETEEGIAVSLALENPDLVGAESFGLAINYGNWEGSSAIGISAVGVIGNNLLMYGDRVAVGGGI